MPAKRKLFLLIIMLGLVALTGLMPQSAIAQVDNQDYGGSGGQGGCNYCSQPLCGCASASGGQTLSYGCSCSSISCSRYCTYS